MELEQKIEKLEEFKELLIRYQASRSADLRTDINHKKHWVEREILEAGYFKTFTISPPPAVGGLMMKNVNPFDCIFDPPYGKSIIHIITDMIDETVGVFMAGEQRSFKEATAVAEIDYEEGYAFIAMAIDPADHELEDVLDSIKEASSQCGIHAERVDEVQCNSRITDRILESINKAQFVIVDLTKPRPNVFYEAGYAQGLNKTPIYVAKHGTRLEFDLKDYPVIFFQNMRELKTGLKERLMALTNA